MIDRMPNLLDNIILRLNPVRLNPARLDSDLAAGRSPETSSRHAARARGLVSPRMRDALASNWEHLLSIAHAPSGGLSHRAPIQRERVHRAEPEIRELIAALRVTGPIHRSWSCDRHPSPDRRTRTRLQPRRIRKPHGSDCSGPGASRSGHAADGSPPDLQLAVPDRRAGSASACPVVRGDGDRRPAGRRPGDGEA